MTSRKRHLKLFSKLQTAVQAKHFSTACSPAAQNMNRSSGRLLREYYRNDLSSTAYVLAIKYLKKHTAPAANVKKEDILYLYIPMYNCTYVCAPLIALQIVNSLLYRYLGSVKSTFVSTFLCLMHILVSSGIVVLALKRTWLMPPSVKKFCYLMGFSEFG